MTTPSGTVTYTFDELNRLKTATDLATGTTTYTYDNVGNLETITYPNETIAEYTYDALNRLTYLENRRSDGTIISSYTYTLDAAGNRTKVVEHTGRTVEYTYDDTYKLLEEKITNPDSSVSVISYTYDKVGNRKTKTENGFTTTYTYNDNNQLVTEDDITYSYDDNGNLEEKTSAEETVEYFYDPENHLIRVETTRFGVTIVVEYEYDAEGNRVRKVIDGTVVINYLVDSNRDYAQVLEERNGDGDLLVRYVYGHDLISQTRDGATTYYHYDGLGRTRTLTSSAEAVTDTYNYDAFGNLLDKTGTTTNTYLFTGEFFDTNIGFYYLRARYMDPKVGRFVTMDTFAGRNRDPYSLHKYLYAHANPVNNTDPSGQLTLNELTVVGGVLGALAGMNVYRLYFDDPSKSTWERAVGYTTFASGGALIGGLLAYGAWYIWLGPALGPGVEFVSQSGGVIKALPFKPQWTGRIINYARGAMSPIEHIMYRHGPNSGVTNVGRFSAGTTARMIKQMVEEAATRGHIVFQANGGGSIVYDFGQQIGTHMDGSVATRILIYFNEFGEVMTAFPIQ